MSFTTIRAFSAQAAESSPANANSFVALAGRSRYVEVSFAPGGSNPSAPTTTHVHLWGSIDGTFRLLQTVDIAAADISRPPPVTLDAPGYEDFYATATFTGGSSPTVTLTVSARRTF